MPSAHAQQPAAERSATILEAARYADFLRAWAAARGGGDVPDEPFDASRARTFESVMMSGGECVSNNVVLRVRSACEVPWSGVGDVWQPLPASDSDNDSVNAEVVATRGSGRGRG